MKKKNKGKGHDSHLLCWESKTEKEKCSLSQSEQVVLLLAQGG